MLLNSNVSPPEDNVKSASLQQSSYFMWPPIKNACKNQKGVRHIKLNAAAHLRLLHERNKYQLPNPPLALRSQSNVGGLVPAGASLGQPAFKYQQVLYFSRNYAAPQAHTHHVGRSAICQVALPILRCDHLMPENK